MKTVRFTLALSVLLALPLPAGAVGPSRIIWEKTEYPGIYPGDFATLSDVQPSFDGGYTVIGSSWESDVWLWASYENRIPKAWLATRDAGHRVIWSRLFADFRFDRVFERVIPCADGGYLAQERKSLLSTVGPVAVLHRIDARGFVLWESDPYPYLEVDSMVQCADGGFAVAGMKRTFQGVGPYTEPRIVVLRLGADGRERWYNDELQLTGTVENQRIVRETAAGGVEVGFLTEKWDETETEYYYRIILNTWGYDASGNVVSGKERLVRTNYRLSGSCRGSDGSFFIVTWDDIPWSDVDTFYLTKADASLNILWTRCLIDRPGEVMSSYSAVQATPDGGCLVAFRDGPAMKIDAGANITWTDDLFLRYEQGRSPRITANGVGDYILRSELASAMMFHDAYDVLPCGRTLLQAEQFRVGGEGYGYHDTDAVNRGGAYRPDGVDIAPLAAGPGYYVGWTAEGEWLAYDIRIAYEGDYLLQLHVSRPQGPTVPTAHLEIDGMDATGPIAIPGTGGDQAWTTIMVRDVFLPEGEHELKLVTHGSSFNIDWLRFERICR